MIDRRIKIHLSILAGLFIINIGFGFYLDTFRLLFSDHGVIFGAGDTDIHAKLFFFRILIVITPIAGIVLMAAGFKGSMRLVLIPPAIVFALYFIGIVIYPSTVQKFKVAPNELALETPYIGHNIKFTRLGYDLDRIEVIPFDVDYNLTNGDIEKNDATIKNIRLWDRGPLLRTYSQLQQIRTYYRFADVDNDRYKINGNYMQVMLSPRELSYNDLPSRSWINERLMFTHGYGIALGPVSGINREGFPEFIIKDIPPVSQADLREKLLLSSDITSESRILYYRNIKDRIRTIAPFLTFDQDPYLVVSGDGRLFWIIDGYTTSSRMPYSKPVARRVNYIRNSVKAVVDAYDGSIGLYVSDPTDIIVQVYSRIFPGMFMPMSDMPDDLRQHIRYPQRFLQVQASIVFCSA